MNIISNKSRRIGFTLLEVLLVLFILVLIAALGVYALRGTLLQQRLKYSADNIRGECLNTNVLAKEEGQIFCMRFQIGGNTILINRVLDTHFTAGLSSRQTSSRYDLGDEYDPYEKGGFTGDMEDFILRNPDEATAGDGTKVIELPSGIIVADVIVVLEERAAFYLGLTAPGETETDEIYTNQEIMTGEIRMGETPGANGTTWSAPIFFYPDGSASTAAVLLKNEADRCIEIRIRGLTGTGMVSEITTATDYIGELEANRF